MFSNFINKLIRVINFGKTKQKKQKKKKKNKKK